MFIYKITNKVNGKAYVGLTKSLVKYRWTSHIRSAYGSGINGKCLAIAAAIVKYGKDSFIVEQIDTASSMDELSKKESEWINKLNTIAPHGYNIRTGGETGYKHSKDSNEKNRLAHLGKKHKPESIEKMKTANLGENNGFFGKKHSEESLNKMSESHKKHVFTETQLINMSVAAKEFHKTETGKARTLKATKASAEVKAIEFTLKSPTGEIFTGKNVLKFCSDKDINFSHICAILKGKRKSHKGWTKG